MSDSNYSDHVIPGATVATPVIARVRERSSVAASELEELVSRIDADDSTDERLIRICELLNEHDESDASLELLRANTLSIGDKVYRRLRRLHGYRIEAEFDEAIISFQESFGVLMTSLYPVDRNWDFMELFFRTEPFCVPADIPKEIGRLIRYPCDAMFKYEVEGTFVDINCLTDEIPEESFVVARYVDRHWIIEECG